MGIHNMLSMRQVLVLPLVLAISGCGMLFGPKGYFRDRGDDYLKAEIAKPVRLPEGVNSNTMGQLFVIPPITNADAPMPTEFQVPKPVNMDVASQQLNEVKIQKLGERSWIAVNSAPDAVWPRVHAFLRDHGMEVARQDPVAGEIETAWLTLKGDDAGRDRYRITLEQGLRNRSTEVHVREVTVDGVTQASQFVAWPAQSVNPEREQWMISTLSEYLAREDTMQASMVAQAIGTGERRVEVVSGADPYLAMRVDRARAWASVGGALGKDGFLIEHSNKEQGQWQVNYSSARAAAGKSAGEADKPGFFRRVFMLMGFGKSQAIVEDRSFQVLLQQSGDAEHVIVRDSAGNALPRADAENYLRIIRANLV